MALNRIHNTEEDQRKRDERYIMMTQSPVKKLVLKMAGPTIISMLVTSFYNIIDAAFVGHISTEATAAVGVSFAYMTFINAIGFFFGHGSGNFISQALGAKNYSDAEKMAATGFLSPFIFGAIAGLLGLIFITPLSKAIGATPDIIAQSNNYLFYILIGTPFMMSALALNNQLRLQGNAGFAMIGITSGAVLNIILDAVFIIGLDMGVTGASLATLISQIVSWIILLIGTRMGGNVHIRLKNLTPTLEHYKQILDGGLPSLCRQVLACTATICLNHSAAIYATAGNEASTIAAFAIVSRCMMFAFSIVLGIGQGFQPICGFNYGAKLYKRVRESYTFTMSIMTMFLLISGTLGFIFAPEIIRFFRSEDPELIAIGTRVMRWQCISFPLIGLSTSTNMLLQTLRITLPATILSMCRQGIFFIPILYIAPLFLGLQGIEMTQAIADVLTFLLAIPMAVKFYKSINTETSDSVIN